MLAKTGLSRTTAYNLERAGDFPRHFMLTPRCAVWDEAEIETWLEGRRHTALPSVAGPDHKLRQNFPGRGKAKAFMGNRL
jgi:prophage regulatory protein